MISKQHDLHKRRFSRNLGVGLVLGATVVLVMGLTMVKVSRGDYDRVVTTEATQ